MLFNTRFDDMIVLENVADIAETPNKATSLIFLQRTLVFSKNSCS